MVGVEEVGSKNSRRDWTRNPHQDPTRQQQRGMQGGSGALCDYCSDSVCRAYVFLWQPHRSPVNKATLLARRHEEVDTKVSAACRDETILLILWDLHIGPRSMEHMPVPKVRICKETKRKSNENPKGQRGKKKGRNESGTKEEAVKVSVDPNGGLCANG